LGALLIEASAGVPFEAGFAEGLGFGGSTSWGLLGVLAVFLSVMVLLSDEWTR
jgi:hypothetical protein